MARQSLTKAALHKQSRQLAVFQRFLPSLDLKRRQLIVERAKAGAALAQTRAKLAEVRASVAGSLPMVGDERIPFDQVLNGSLVTIKAIEKGTENLMGQTLPVLDAVTLEVQDYGLLATPHWIEPLIDRIKDALELRVRMQVEEERLALLNISVRKITQRVNLFDKVLIPRTQATIKRNKIHLADSDRAAVVRAKLAKQKSSHDAIEGAF